MLRVHLERDERLGPRDAVDLRDPAGDHGRQVVVVRDARDRDQAELAGDGRVLVRPSGTEPKIRLMIQARDAALAERVVGQLAEDVRRALAGQ